MTYTDFDYYKYNNRLIKVNGSTYFKDITPFINYPLTSKELKAAFKKWVDDDLGDWEFIASYTFGTDNDLFMKMYDGFKSKYTEMNKPKRKRTIITPEMIVAIKKRLDRGDSMYSIAQFFGISQTTACKYSTP